MSQKRKSRLDWGKQLVMAWIPSAPLDMTKGTGVVDGSEELAWEGLWQEWKSSIVYSSLLVFGLPRGWPRAC